MVAFEGLRYTNQRRKWIFQREHKFAINNIHIFTLKMIDTMFNNYQIKDFFENIENAQHFHINKLDEMPPLPSHIQNPHKHQFYEVLLIQEGETTQNIDYQDFKIESTTLFFISQGQLHLWGKTNTNTIKGFRLMFTEEFFLQNYINKNFLFELVFLDNVYFYPCISLTEETQKPISNYFELLHQEFQREDKNPKVLQSLLYIVLIEIQRFVNQKEAKILPSKHLATYKLFVELLENQFQKHLSVGEYANRLCISEKQLNRMVKSVTNKSVGEVIKNRIILESKRLLTSTDLNINQIADELGFENSAYFARYFKKETNFSPTEFKTIYVLNISKNVLKV